MSQRKLQRVAFIGNYLPRRCGIATFTTDLCEAVTRADESLDCYAVAMNDRRDGYAYPPAVRFEIDALEREQYDLAADFINVNQADVVCVQHEYGIYGGRAGRFLLPMLRQIRVPIVTTLHTVLDNPDDDQKEVMTELGELSDRMIVMSPRAEGYLRDLYHVPSSRVRLIHHGIPDMPFVDPNYFKDRFNAEGRPLLLTFGLLSPGKGIEYAISALPRVVEKFPDVLYVVLGATHPHIKRQHGEEYRMGLVQRARELGVGDNVVFQNRFVELPELCEYLGAADLYITPYLNETQIVSGTLAYAMGTGKAVVSTPYWYAQDMLADGRGAIVPFRDAEALGDALLHLIENESERHAMRKRAYGYGRGMIWKEVARQYIETFEQARKERARAPRPARAPHSQKQRTESLPELNARHLLAMTDSTGIIQHARFTVPDVYHGYSTDDQARALILAVRASHTRPNVADWDLLEARYLSFLLYAFDSESGRFGNFMNSRREWTKPVATEDVHARAAWGLANVVAWSQNAGHRGLAMQLLERAIPETLAFSSPRAWAFAILAIQTYLTRYSGASSFRRERRELAMKLLHRFKDGARDDWPWPEDRLTYVNARLPQALIEVGQWLPDREAVEWGLRALDWLDRVQTPEEGGHFVPVGSDGWFPRGGNRARFDQQPVEAYAMIDASIAAYRTTHDPRWQRSAERAFDWFLGRNDLSLPVCDYRSGGCHDGLHPDRLNQNQGAESTLSWMLSLLLMVDLQEEQAGEQRRDAALITSPATSGNAQDNGSSPAREE